MKKVTVAKILKAARKLNKEGKKWHFHILTPGCVFNKNKKFALILEVAGKNDQLIHLSLRKPEKTGQKLVDLLHGEGISKKKSKSTSVKISPKVNSMLKRAQELSNKGFSWHHHLLFPDCIFNKDPRYWSLVFEDPLNGETIEDKTKSEPKDALQLIEPLFYAQKK